VDPGVLVDIALHAVEVDGHRRKSWEFVAATVEVDGHRKEILGIYSSRTMQVDMGPDVWYESSSCLEQLTYLGSRK